MAPRSSVVYLFGFEADSPRGRTRQGNGRAHTAVGERGKDCLLFAHCGASADGRVSMQPFGDPCDDVAMGGPCGT
jgi:hypothetical protein